MSAQDRIDYDTYLAGQYAAWLEHTSGSGYIWDARALARAGRDVPTALDAWRGPWRNVRPYVSTEFRQWVEEHFLDRVTFAEWQAQRIQERRETAETKRDYVESADYCLDRLESWAELNRERDEQICEARERGATFRELSEATGLTRMALHNVIEKARMREVCRLISEAETMTAESAAAWIPSESELAAAF